jgi:hypothetical protein
MTMAKRKYPKMTAEEHAARDRTQRMALERIAYHAAKAREQGWAPPEGVTDATEWMVRDRIAYHEAKAREQEQAAERGRQ